MSVLLRNNVKLFGSGTVPIVFAHGYGCDQNMWRLVTPAFEEKYKIVLYDHVGFGKSDLTAFQPQKYSTLNGYAQDLTRNLPRTRNSENHFCWSFGGSHDRSVGGDSGTETFSENLC